MNILFVFGGLRLGGYEMLNLRLAQKLSEKGYTVSLLVISGKKDLLDRVGENVKVYFLRRKCKLDISIIFRIRQLIKKVRPQVIFGCDFLEYLFPRLAISFMRRKPSSVMAFHVTRPVVLSDHLWNIIFSLIDRIFKDHKLAIFRSQIDFFVESYHMSRKRFHLIYNGIDTGFFAPDSKTMDNPDTLILVHIASLKPLKDQWTLLRTMVELDRRVKEWTLKIAGEDVADMLKDYQDFIRKVGLEKKIHFMGPVNDVRTILNGADVFLLTSRTEALPLSIMEALSMGVPVITTNVGGCGDLVSNGVEGYLTDVGDYEAIASRIQYLYENPEILKKMKISARERVKNKFSFDNMVKNYMNLFHKVAPVNE